jgi:serine phosphatase RsbU (regulator of sigma subunit)
MGLFSLLGAPGKLSVLLTKIQNTIKDFAAGEKQQDDITLLAVRCKKK